MTLEVSPTIGVTIVVLIIFLVGGLAAWVWYMRREIWRMKQFRRGVEKLLEKGIISGVDRVCFERTLDGWRVAFEGPPKEPCHEVIVLDDPDFQISD